VAAHEAVERSGQDPLARSPLLHLELLLHAARIAEGSREPGEFVHACRQLVADIVAGTGLARTSGGPFAPHQLAAILLAMEDGLRLHRLIDPDGTPAASFVRSLGVLQAAFRGGQD
jgi:hypothetical protein